MVKKLEGRTLWGVALFVIFLYLGLLLRFTNLSEVSVWTDEVATWFYSHHLSEIYPYESHTPVYYFFCFLWNHLFSDTIVSLRFFSVVMNLSLTLVCAWVFSRHRGYFAGLILFVLWWMWPTSIIYSRQARLYGMYADLSLLLLILWHFKNAQQKWGLWWLMCLIQGLHPLGLIVCWFLVFYDGFLKRITVRRMVFFISSALPTAIYLGSRFNLYGNEKVLSNISWIKHDPLRFMTDVLLLFGGDSYPLNVAYPLSSLAVWLLIFVTLIVILIPFKVSRASVEVNLKGLLLLVLTVGLIELLSLNGITLSVNRYVIYLVSFMVFGFCLLVGDLRESGMLKKAVVLGALLLTYNAYYFKPFLDFPWDDDHIASFKSLYAQTLTDDLVICGNRYQLKYYFDRPYKDCIDEALLRLKEKKAFKLFNMNKNDQARVATLINEAQVLDYKWFNDHALYVSLAPKVHIEKSK